MFFGSRLDFSIYTEQKIKKYNKIIGFMRRVAANQKTIILKTNHKKFK